MAIKGRTWESLDILISEFTNEKREEIGNPPIRKMAEAMGISYSRFRDILNQANGTPTLNEFLIICEYFNVDPASTLELLMRQAGMSDAATLPSVEDSTSSALADRDDYKLVANEDENKNNEMYDYYD